ncbi:MAG: Rqc2 family fibronectin-binding protein [Halanaerobiales bacterium]
MAVDGLSLHVITNELKDKIINGRIQKSHQPKKDQLIINIYNQKSNYKVLINSNAEGYRLHLTEQDFENPYQAPMFCMLLRKHIDGGRLLDVKQPGLERIIEFVIESRDDLGNLINKSLIVELMGKYSNIILLHTDTRKIIDAITRVPFGMSSVRQVLPGLTYEIPPSNKKDIFDDYEMEIENPTKDFVKLYEGISPLVARELIHRFETFDKSVNELRNIITNNLFEPSITFDNRGRVLAGALKYTHIGNEYKEFEFMNEAIDNQYEIKVYNKKINSIKNKLASIINNEIKKLKKTIKKQEKKYRESLKANEYKRQGDLIKANLYQIEEGKEKVIVVDYYSEDMPEITIELNPKKSPQRNLKEYYKKYEKAIRTQKMTQKYIKKNKNELDYLESILSNIESSEDLETLEEIKSELIESKYMKDKEKKDNLPNKDKKQESKSEPRSFYIDGFKIEVGKNNKQNDYLTLRKANKEDIWFHTKNIPGSHVVIRNNGQEVSDEVLLKAANLAAYYSKAKNSSNVPVDYTQIKNVYKQKGSHPGQVFYTDQKTIYITPEKPE